MGVFASLLDSKLALHLASCSCWKDRLFVSSHQVFGVLCDSVLSGCDLRRLSDEIIFCGLPNAQSENWSVVSHDRRFQSGHVPCGCIIPSVQLYYVHLDAGSYSVFGLERWSENTTGNYVVRAWFYCWLAICWSSYGSSASRRSYHWLYCRILAKNNLQHSQWGIEVSCDHGALSSSQVPLLLTNYRH